MAKNEAAFEYRIGLTFDEGVRDHHWQVRGAPALGQGWAPRSLRVSLEPAGSYRVRRDPSGNLTYHGETPAVHRAWAVTFSGTGAWTGLPEPRFDGDTELSATGALTRGGPALDRFWARWCEGRPEPQDRRPGALAERLADALLYRPGVTTADTSADEALGRGAGVCQDWAHAFLALWRRAGGVGRYVAGFASTEGETHAWVELASADGWRGYDPLRRCATGPGWLAVARGRDAADCRFNRGAYRGGGTSTLEVSVRLSGVIEAVR